MNSNNLIEYG